MSGKYRVISLNKWETDQSFEDFNGALTSAKETMAWNDTPRKIFIVQEVAQVTRPPVDNAIVTTL